MDALRTPIQPLSRPKRIGQPYHGKLVGGALTLSTGRQITWAGGSLFGDCYRLKVPGVSLTLAPAEVASEATQGREWRDYALLTGYLRSYAGTDVGSQAWLYAATDGTVWRIECPQLDGAWLQPSPPAGGASGIGKYPGSADFEFRIRRWGVISPDGEDTEPTYTRTIHCDFGVELDSDPMSDTSIWPRERRLFLGDGQMWQFCPINIEDMSSQGNKVLFGVGRTNHQSANSETQRGVAQIWLLVEVSGTGGDGITITMSAYRTSRDMSQSFNGPDFVTESSGVWHLVGPDWHWEVSGTTDVIVGDSGGTHRSGTVAGLYFDSADQIRTVGLSSSESLYNSTSPSGSASVSGGFEGVGSSAAAFEGSATVTASVHMGPHGYSAPTVSLYVSGVRSTTIDQTAGINDVSWSYTLTVNGGVLGNAAVTFNNVNWSYESGWPAPSGSGAGDGMPERAIATFEINMGIGLQDVGGAMGLRDWDGLALVRVTHKVYAVVGSRGPDRFNQPTGFKVIAIGTPDGWISGPSLATHVFASYNPGTGELAHSAAPVGWV